MDKNEKITVIMNIVSKILSSALLKDFEKIINYSEELRCVLEDIL